jgi:hypothetical protein
MRPSCILDALHPSDGHGATSIDVRRSSAALSRMLGVGPGSGTIDLAPSNRNRNRNRNRDITHNRDEMTSID